MNKGNTMPKASELLEQSADPFDKACMMVRDMEREIELLKNLVWSMEQQAKEQASLIDQLKQELEVQWLQNHVHRCTNMEDCASFGYINTPCREPRPALLAQPPVSFPQGRT